MTTTKTFQTDEALANELLAELQKAYIEIDNLRAALRSLQEEKESHK